MVELILLNDINKKVVTKKLHFLKIRYSSGPRITISKKTNKCFSNIYNQVKQRSCFPKSLKNINNRVTNTERLFVIVCTYRANLNNVQKISNISKRYFFIRKDENGNPLLCIKSSLFGAIPELESKAVILLIINCFAKA